MICTNEGPSSSYVTVLQKGGRRSLLYVWYVGIRDKGGKGSFNGLLRFTLDDPVVLSVWFLQMFKFEQIVLKVSV